MKEYVLPSTGIYYRINDFQKDRQTLVFIHGLSGNSSAWEPYEQEFMDKYNMLCIDLRGHGRSKKYSKKKDYAMELFVDDIEELFDHLGIKKCIIISHSFGSVIAVGLIQRDPDRIKGAIFLAPAFKSKHAVSTLSMRLVSGILSFFSRALPISERPGKRIDYSRLLPTSDWDVRRIWTDVRNTGLAIYFFCLHSLYLSMDDGFFERLHLPVLVIHGKRDSYISLQHSIKASKHIAGAQLVVLPMADHMLVLNCPTEISKIMADFFDSSI
jgi:pimeloyl-ACP methyl ester carboxylesterase